MLTTLAQILNRSEKQEYDKEYKVIEQNGICGKPTIVAGSENLKRFNLPIKLHASFCNPQKIIDEIEEKAENREVINYFVNDKYIGDYVIERFRVNVSQTIKKAVFYAEIEINLVENPESITAFEEQTIQTPEILQEVFEENSNVMKDFAKKSKEIIKQNITNAIVSVIETGSINGLSSIGETILQNYSDNIIAEIKEKGLPFAKEIADEYSSKVEDLDILEQDQIAIIQSTIAKIPEKMIDTSLRC